MGTGRMRLFAACFLAAVVSCIPVTRPAAEAGPPGIDAFIARVAQMLAAALPKAEVTVSGPRTLRVRSPQMGDGQINLERLSEFCARNRKDCDAALRTFVANVVERQNAAARPVERAIVRAVIRPAAYIEAARQSLGAHGGELVAVPFAGDLWLVCVADYPTTTRLLNVDDLRALDLDREAAIALAKSNLATVLRPIGNVAASTLPQDAFGTISGDDYESSRVLLHEQWADLAKRFDGNLIVALPGSRLVLYGDARGPNAVDAMATLARKIAETQQRPISASVLRWTPDGWRPASP
jgi:uncharacterized protein YtpQ (UPF0354 family)